MISESNFRLAIFDVAGTTVIDNGMVIEAFLDAIQPLESDPKRIAKLKEIANKTMGERKIDVFREMFIEEDSAQAAHDLFIESYLKRVIRGEVSPVPGVETLFRKLRNQGMKIALNTGFSREILNAILESLDWFGVIDFSIASNEVTKGRPSPEMINSLIRQVNNRLAIEIDSSQVVVFGDTIADMAAASAAGAKLKIGVNSGVHDRSQLLLAGADLVVDYIYDSLFLIQEKSTRD